MTSPRRLKHPFNFGSLGRKASQASYRPQPTARRENTRASILQRRKVPTGSRRKRASPGKRWVKTRPASRLPFLTARPTTGAREPICSNRLPKPATESFFPSTTGTTKRSIRSRRNWRVMRRPRLSSNVKLGCGARFGFCHELEVVQENFLRVAASPSAPTLIEWMGHSTFQITSSKGTRVLTDPHGAFDLPHPTLPQHIVTTSHQHGPHNSVGMAPGN